MTSPLSNINVTALTSELKSSLAPFSGYFKKSLAERRELLIDYHINQSTSSTEPTFNKQYDIDSLSSLLSSGLSLDVANIMVENCIGYLGLPLGVLPTLVMNGKHYIVPMCVEEPSVIAAASGIAKLIADSGGGFTATSTANIMTGEIQLLSPSTNEDTLSLAIDKLNEFKSSLITAGNTYCTSMLKRGGGVKDIRIKLRTPSVSCRKNSFILILVDVDVCDSMGANMINTICEGITPTLLNFIHPICPSVRSGLRILTNLCTLRRSYARFVLPLSSLSWKGVEGIEVANRIVDAYHFACDDEQRAVTNNKGIMNGMDAVAVATGQDWRALEAAAHAWAAVQNSNSELSSPVPGTGNSRHYSSVGKERYGPLGHYHIEGDNLIGECEIPISVGTAGGALSTHPVYKFSLSLLNQPDARTLACLIVCVGLAQNFAAIRALAVEGIQKGHMALHAKNIAIAAGASTDVAGEVTDYLVAIGKVNKQTATEYLQARSTLLSQSSNSNNISNTTHLSSLSTIPSTLFISLPASLLPPHTPVDLHILFFLPTEFGIVRLSLADGIKVHPLQSDLFNENEEENKSLLISKPWRPLVENISSEVCHSLHDLQLAIYDNLIEKITQTINKRQPNLLYSCNSTDSNEVISTINDSVSVIGYFLLLTLKQNQQKIKFNEK